MANSVQPRKGLLPGIWPTALHQSPNLLPGLWLSLAAGLVAAFLMPQQSPFPYRFEKAQPWNYSTLKAPFDFEVLYPEAQVRDQLDQINAEHAPYFLLRPELARRQKQQLAEQIQEQTRIGKNDTRYEDLVAKPAAYISFGQQMLDYLYSKGVGGGDVEGLRQDNPNAEIMLVNGAYEQRIPVAQFFTLSTAREFLSDTLPYSPLRQPELLLAFLEKALAPNVQYSDSLTVLSKRKKIAAVVSTGITVRKGEVIVRNSELVSDDIFRKLNSLSQRFDAPKRLPVTIGYALLAWVAFGIYFFWLAWQYPEMWQNRVSLLLAPVVVLLLLLLVSLSTWVGLAIALIIPVWGLPLLWKNTYPAPIAWASWGLVVLLSTISLDWGPSWMALQVAGAAAAYLFFGNAQGLKAQGLGAGITLLVQVAIWLACLLAGKLPAGLQSADVILLLLIANGLLFSLSPLRRLLESGGLPD